MFCYFFVALEGFEPSQAEPESDVLPLHHKAILIVANLDIIFNIVRVFAIKVM